MCGLLTDFAFVVSLLRVSKLGEALENVLDVSSVDEINRKGNLTDYHKNWTTTRYLKQTYNNNWNRELSYCERVKNGSKEVDKSCFHT